MDLILCGSRIRNLRHNIKQSVDQVAKEIGMQKSSLANIERGVKAPSVDVLLSLADYFCVSLDYLTGRSDDENGAKAVATDYFAIPTSCDRMSIEVIRLNIGGRLKQLRSDMNYTQAELACYIGVAQNTYANYENENRSVSDDIKLKLADFFGVSLDFLLGRSDDPQTEIYLKKGEKQ